MKPEPAPSFRSVCAGFRPGSGSPLAARAVAALVCLSAGWLAHADEPTHEMLDSSLDSRAVRLLGWDEATITIVDEDGLRRDTRIETVLAVRRLSRGVDRWRRPTTNELAGGTAVVLDLTDGQRFIGSLGPWDSESTTGRARAVIGDDESIPLLSPRVHTGQEPADDATPRIDAVPLDSIRRILFDPWASRAASARGSLDLIGDADPVDDEIVFLNGDRVSGFLVALDQDIVFDTDAGERSFPIDRLAELRLGNPTEASAGPRLWLVTGEIRDGRTLTGIGSGTAAATSDAIVAAWFSDQERIPLAELPRFDLRPGPGRRWAKPLRTGSAGASPLGIPDLEIDGPSIVSWALPPSASAFSSIAVLGGSLERPDAAPGIWADAVIRVSIRASAASDPVVLTTIRLNSEAGLAPIACDLSGVGDPGRTLIVEVLAGAHGPVQDRVLLRRPFLLGD